MAPVIFTFRLVPGIRISSGRAVGFLEGHPDLNAGSSHAAFRQKVRDEMNVNIQRWTDGHDLPKTRFHGFTSGRDYRECFVFKHKEHRLYGFLCNPRKEVPGFRLCVLTTYVTKNEWETDESVLKEVEVWRTRLVTQEALQRFYPEPKKGALPWKS
jgi:hypothetical protein